MNVIAFSVYVFSPNKERLGEVRSITSMQWMEEYAGVGEVKLVCAATPNNRQLLRSGLLLFNSDRPHLLAQIQPVEIDDDMQTAKMTVRAKMTACRLEERVLMHTLKITEAEAGMRKMVIDNQRGLPITVAAAKRISERYDGQISWSSVLDAEIKVAQCCGLGFMLRVDADLNEIFEVYKGVDRTDPNGPDYVGFWSDTAGNVKRIKLIDDESQWRNVAIVAGEGQGQNRKVLEVDLSNGNPRREIYVDASDLSSQYTTTNADGSTVQHTMTEEEYTAALRERGMQAIANTLAGSQVTAEIGQSMMLFGRDYELGDVLPLCIGKYGLFVKVRLIKVTLIYEQTKSIKATLEVVN